MSLFNQLFEWLKRFDKGDELRLWFERQPLPPITFSDLKSIEKPPNNENVKGKTFYCVFSASQPKWVLFRCPCGCGNVITLSLQHSHQPHWILKKSKNNRPLLYPSVWRDTGCLSHFWIQDGRVYWCTDTGTSPFARSFSV